MDFLHAALPELQERVFFTVASLLDLEVDLLFFDTSSTYWETDRLPDELQDQDDAPDPEEPDEEPALVESGRRRYSKHSKDHRPDLPQVVVGMAVTRKGIPVRVWTFPGNASDQVIIRKVKDDLRGWNLSRVIWVLDRGFTSERNRRYLQRGGGHYIVGEKLRSDSKEASAALARQGRYHTVAGNLRVKQVRIDDGTNRDRFVICHNPERAERDQLVREQILDRLRQEIHTRRRPRAVQALRALRRAVHQARLQALPAQDPDRQAADRPRRRRPRGQARRQVPAAGPPTRA